MFIKVLKLIDRPIIDISVYKNAVEPIDIHFNHADNISLTIEEADELATKLSQAIQECNETDK